VNLTLNRRMWRSAEFLSHSGEAVWSDASFLVASIHWFVALVAWQFDLIVLDDVLLDDGLSCAKLSSLTYCLRVVICSWDEAVIAWNVSGCFSGSCGQLVILIEGLGGFTWEFISWVVSVGS